MLRKTVVVSPGNDTLAAARAAANAVETPPRRLVNCHEAGRLLDIAELTVRGLCWRGELPHVRVGRLVKIEVADIEAYIDKCKQAAR